MMMHSGLTGNRAAARRQARNLKDSLKLFARPAHFDPCADLGRGFNGGNIFGPLLLGQAITLLAQGSPSTWSASAACCTNPRTLLALGVCPMFRLIMAGIATNITYRFRREFLRK
jgi:hypothetical protein